MRSVCCAGVTLLACSLAAVAETKQPCGETVSRPLASRAELMIDSKPAGLEIIGTDAEQLHVTCTAASDESAAHVSLRFVPSAGGGKLSIEGPQLHHGNNNLHVRIEVPHRTNIVLRMFAGQVTVEGVKGDKDIHVGAGQITIAPVHVDDYRSVNASVTIGQVQAPAFGSDKGGFFRSIKSDHAGGDYRLEAHVTTGQIELLSTAAPRHDDAKSD